MNETLYNTLVALTDEEKSILNGEDSNVLHYSTTIPITLSMSEFIEGGKQIAAHVNCRFTDSGLHKHNYIEIAYMLSGSTTHMIDGKRELVLKKGEFLLLNQHALHYIKRAELEDVAINILITPEYFDISNGEEGIIGAIGWSGQWTCNMNYTENGVRIDAGMRKTSISLHSDEEMRTPSIVLLFFEGDVNDDGHNLWRDMMLNHYNPTDENDEPITTMPVWDTIGGGVKYKDALNYIKRVNNGNIYYDGVWVDAGWYSEDVSTSDWYEATGNWFTPESRYPEGYSMLTDILKENGKGFMLWFEPERAMEGTYMVETYPQYFMYQYKSAQYYVWNFADDEAVDFLIDYISDIIQDYGITWYRQDCNMDPLPRWEITDDMDGENRTGITEIRYITNMYRYWDTLVEENEGLMIDNCAAGGRRLDIEMCKRSLACWRSDYYNIEGTADGCRKIAMNISYWLPVSGGGESSTEGNDNAYEYRSSMVNQVLVRTYPKGGRQWNTLTDQYLEIREAMAKNYYGLLVPEDYASENGAYEFIDTEAGEGFIALFRPENSDDDSIFVTLKGLDVDAEYVLTNMDGGDSVTATGRDLMEKGINVTMNEARLSKLISIEVK